MSRESNALTYNHKIQFELIFYFLFFLNEILIILSIFFSAIGSKSKFTNMMMRDGRAMTARNVVDKTMFKIKLKQVEKVNKATTEEEKAKIEADPVKIMLKAFENCKPILKLTPVKKGGITYQVPVPMTEKEREFKSFKFILKACEDKPDTMRIYDRLSNELIDASNFAVIHFLSFFNFFLYIEIF